ncbi:MAG: [FeFe] hydrogenase H-cluster radical SAM maturase HydE [Syntrophales bacterium]
MKETSISETNQELIDKAVRTGAITKEEIVRILSHSEKASDDALFRAADEVRKTWVGDDVHLRGIVEFSSFCERNCLYCGLRKDNRKPVRYRIPDNAIVEAARAMKDLGVSTIVLQSGEDPYYDAARICRLVERIKRETSLAVTLSIGERSPEDYRAFKESGTDRYLLKHETASPELYRSLHPDSRFRERIQCLIRLKEIGYETGSGAIIGLPGQNAEMIADDVLLMKRMDIDMIGMGPFIPHPETPLAGAAEGKPEMVIKVLALTRILTRSTNIPATTALAVLDPDSRLRALQAGANVIMPDFTPGKYRRRYEIYPGKGNGIQDIGLSLKQLERDLNAIGRRVGTGDGSRSSARAFSSRS